MSRSKRKNESLPPIDMGSSQEPKRLKTKDQEAEDDLAKAFAKMGEANNLPAGDAPITILGALKLLGENIEKKEDGAQGSR